MLSKPNVLINVLSHLFMGDVEGRGVSYLLLEFFELVIFLFSVFFNLFLRFALGVFDSFGAVWEGWLGGGEVVVGEKGEVHSRAKGC